MGKKIGLILLVLLAGISISLKLFLPSLKIWEKQNAGTLWDDSFDDYKQFYVRNLSGTKDSHGLDFQQIEAVSNCSAQEMTAFLNTTDCTPFYNENITSEEKHMADQDACFARVGYEKMKMRSLVKCAVPGKAGLNQASATALQMQINRWVGAGVESQGSQQVGAKPNVSSETIAGTALVQQVWAAGVDANQQPLTGLDLYVTPSTGQAPYQIRIQGFPIPASKQHLVQPQAHINVGINPTNLNMVTPLL